ncbi:uncharacterized protein LOC106465769 isoform X2 [Limulus polyphemus]|uniref:Uncharacterized protein LOC106465769 isoform X2 n=1 Tax=Limulus polyphemus TaxID=6850 RepID=A0ABM1T0K2_LIMPO|nr:uncharacterized protein LOC106465769 isoform X2 [Limulus polyphemus]
MASNSELYDFYVGEEFYSWEEFQEKLKRFIEHNHIQLRVLHSKSVEVANRYLPENAKKHPSQNRFASIMYTCVHYGKPRIRSRGLRPNQSSLKLECASKLYISSCRKTGKLVVKTFVKEHNHEIGPQISYQKQKKYRSKKDQSSEETLSLTNLLICLRHENDWLFTEGVVTKNQAWDLIAQKATELSGILISGKQCFKECKNIERKHKEVEHPIMYINNKDGELEVDDIIPHLNAQPSQLCKDYKSEDLHFPDNLVEMRECDISALADDDDENNLNQFTSTSEIIQALNTFRKERKKDEEDRMKRLEEMHKERMQLLEKIVNAIKQ